VSDVKFVGLGRREVETGRKQRGRDGTMDYTTENGKMSVVRRKTNEKGRGSMTTSNNIKKEFEEFQEKKKKEGFR